MAMVRSFEVMLGQAQNHSAYNSEILCNKVLTFLSICRSVWSPLMTFEKFQIYYKFIYLFIICIIITLLYIT
jgi:hypothetical protein